MSTPKLSSNLSIEELIAIANSISDDETSEEGLNHAERFIMSNNVVVGEDRVLPTIIWLRYLEWCESQMERPIGRYKFWDQFNKHFTRQRAKTARYYLLNKEVFNLSNKNKKKLVKVREQQKREYGNKEDNEEK